MPIPIIDTILGAIKGPLDKLIPDKNARREMDHELQMKLMDAGLDQIAVNKEEAKHKSIFVAGWRPFVGWVCGVALMWHFILYDLLTWVTVVFFPDVPPLPQLSGTETLITVLMGMLGLGGLRTLEKIKGVSRER